MTNMVATYYDYWIFLLSTSSVILDALCFRSHGDVCKCHLFTKHCEPPTFAVFAMMAMMAMDPLGGNLVHPSAMLAISWSCHTPYQAACLLFWQLNSCQALISGFGDKLCCRLSMAQRRHSCATKITGKCSMKAPRFILSCCGMHMKHKRCSDSGTVS